MSAIVIKRKKLPSLREATKCYAAELDPNLSDEWSIAAYGISLPRSLRKACKKRVREFVIGRYCASLAIANLGMKPPPQIAIRSDRSPGWPEGIVGSITHTDDYVWAACAIGIRGIGIDSERILTEKVCADVLNKVVTKVERQLGNRIGTLSYRALVTLIFSAKESIYKCLRPLVGHYFDYFDVEITAIDTRQGSFTFRLSNPLSDEFPVGFQQRGYFKLTENHVHTWVELP